MLALLGVPFPGVRVAAGRPYAHGHALVADDAPVLAEHWTFEDRSTFARECSEGRRPATSDECFAAVQEAASRDGLEVIGFKKVEDGAGQGVPDGCSYSHHSKKALFNEKYATNDNTGDYQLVCLAPAQDAANSLLRRERHVRVVSVHVGNSDWVSKQGEMVARYIDLPYSLYTSTDDFLQNETVHKWIVATGNAPAYMVTRGDLRGNETTLVERCILNADPSCDHGVQLHHLAKRACDAEAPEDDLLVFLDSDAWPLSSLSENVVPLLDAENGIDLVAVRRSVEGMALWPHPSFAVTTCGAWNRNNHSFSQPPDDEDPDQVVERLEFDIFNASRGLLCHDHFKLDTGAPLWRHFNDTSNNWVALDRMNKLDIDPLFYGVYGINGVPMAYHQGAGSRHTATSKVVPVADGSPDGYDDVAFKIDDMVLDLMSQPNGTELLIQLLLRPRSSPYFRANAMHSLAYNSSMGYTDTAAYARTLVDTCMELRYKLLRVADVKYDKLLKADVPHDCVFSGGKLQGAEGGECAPQFCVGRSEALCTPQLALDLVHIPKTGGTAIEVWGREQSPPMRWGRFRNAWPQGACYWGCRQTWQPCSAWHLPPAIFRSQGYPAYRDASNNMCVVRNPFDRAASQVTWLLRNKALEDPTVCEPAKLNEHVRAVLDDLRESMASVTASFPNLAHSDMLRSDTMDPVLASSCLDKESDKECQNRVTQPAFREDCHWLPQWMYVEGECEHVMRTETLTDDFRNLMSDVGGIEGAELPTSDNARNVSACPIDASMFDEENEALIREVYAKDFALYDYDTALDRSAVAAASEDRALPPSEVIRHDILLPPDSDVADDAPQAPTEQQQQTLAPPEPEKPEEPEEPEEPEATPEPEKVEAAPEPEKVHATKSEKVKVPRITEPEELEEQEEQEEPEKVKKVSEPERELTPEQTAALSCVAVAGQTAVSNKWCVQNCGNVPSNCPANLCTCDGSSAPESATGLTEEALVKNMATSPAPEKVKASSESEKVEVSPEPNGAFASCTAVSGQTAADDKWCVVNCGNVPPNCPDALCTCEGSSAPGLPGDPADSQHHEQQQAFMSADEERVKAADAAREVAEERLRNIEQEATGIIATGETDRDQLQKARDQESASYSGPTGVGIV